MTDINQWGTASLRGRLVRDESMARHTSWRAGGAAARAYTPADLADLRAFLAAMAPDEPVLFVGLGSNLLVRDGGLRGSVVFTHAVLNRIQLETAANAAPLVYAEAGVASPKLSRFAALHGLAGAEFFAGIPGTIGGALAMNAGCYGGETWRVVERVTTVDRRGGLHTRTPGDYDLGYRHVRPRAATEEWFVSAHFRLPAGDGDAARATVRQLLERRIATQPLSQPNAGSVFRNPPNDHAARLIEACGLKGHRQGAAAISDKHANFIVNLGGARATDIEALIVLAETAVRERFDIVLEREVRIVGEAA
ncbi:MAG: UDP-N-acetylmuramate dehydrogenase [Burkholderiales bacterium]